MIFLGGLPLAVALAEECGVYAGAGELSIDEWAERYVESGTALREWVALWAVAQQALAQWAEVNGGVMENLRETTPF